MKKNKKNVEENIDINNSEEKTNEKIESTNTEEISKEENQLQELNDKYIRLYSEFDNYRKRTNKEKIDIITNANASLIKDLLPIIDDFERAIINNENNNDVDSLKEGFNLIFNKFFNLLNAKGLKVMEAKEKEFDSELHDAIANIPAPSPELIGFVIDDVEKGYFLNDTILRHAKVVVGQ